MFRMMLMLLFSGPALAGSTVQCTGFLGVWESIKYVSRATIAEREAKEAAKELRKPRPVPPNGWVEVTISRSTIDGGMGANFMIAFGDSVEDMDRRPQEQDVPSPFSSSWWNTFVEPVPSLPTTVHVVDRVMSRRCSATIDARGRVKRVK